MVMTGDWRWITIKNIPPGYLNNGSRKIYQIRCLGYHETRILIQWKTSHDGKGELKVGFFYLEPVDLK